MATSTRGGAAQAAPAAGAAAAAHPRQDPFYSVKEKVETSWSSISSRFEEWQQLSASASPDTSKVGKSIKEMIRAVIVDLNDLEQTIQIVENNRAKFTNIDNRELNTRKAFVTEMKEQIREVKDAVTSAKASRQSEQSIHAALVTNKPKPKPKRITSTPDYEETDRAAVADNDDIVSNQQRQQQEIEAEQDEVLVDMEEALGNLTRMADDINQDLHEQKDMLNELEGNIDHANDTIKMVNAKLEKLLGTSDKGRLCCILILFILAIVLFILIIYG